MSINHWKTIWPTHGFPALPPQELGMNQHILAALDRYAEREETRFRAILIVRHGHLAFEKYYRGQQLSDYHRIASATKSIISALVGVALQEGYLHSLEQPLIDFFPEFVTPEMDARMKQVTLHHLMTMTSGFSYEEWQHNVVRWEQGEGDWAAFAFSLPMAFEPGQHFQYNALGIHLISIILTKVTGRSTLEFARQMLFQPLGISTDEKSGFFWMQDPEGYYRGGGGMRLRPRDMAKFGYLYLKNGLWEQNQLLPTKFIKRSTQQHTMGGPPVNEPYGYLWWTTQHDEHDLFFASGIGGQIIAVIPDLDIVVVIASTNEAHLNEKKQRDIIANFIIPAIHQKQQ
ncbi:serine hydrolase domain-containing protein [Dictyobacter kobayashii]|uniref:6-aminohexanoate-dimer hydrolase n=1 Tax=Dictyobacter kobayashii TaxID=2014872 RepID=A0A402AVY0_9CHLR|nr:serine hydrolase [Dictyobacter kobayashii]GCE23256.1 6-aminohexanoate-dimer hydrolase [Dictyobacter kobayashii]